MYPPGSFPIPPYRGYSSAIPGMMPASPPYPGSMQQPMPQYPPMAILNALAKTIPLAQLAQFPHAPTGQSFKDANPYGAMLAAFSTVGMGYGYFSSTPNFGAYAAISGQPLPPIHIDPSFLAGLNELNSKREQNWREQHLKMLHKRWRRVHYIKREGHLNSIINELSLGGIAESSAQDVSIKHANVSSRSNETRAQAIFNLSHTKLVILHGAPGSGKSTLACDLVAHLQSTIFLNKKLNAFWINARNVAKLQQNIEEMVNYLGDKQLIGIKSSKAVLAETFRSRDENFVIVLDNAEFDNIKEYLEAWEGIPKLILIVTTLSKFKHKLEVHCCERNLSSGFSPKEAIEYLKQTVLQKDGSAKPFDEEGAKALLKQIGYLPLDLQLVANELNVQKKSYREYAEYILEEKHSEPKSFQVIATLQRAWLDSWKDEHHILEADSKPLDRELINSPTIDVTYQRFHDLIERWNYTSRFDKEVKETAGWPLLLLCSVLDGTEISDDMLKTWFNQRKPEKVPKLKWEINYQNLLKYFVDNNLLYEPAEISIKKNESQYYSMHQVTQAALISFEIEKQKLPEAEVDKYYKNFSQQYRNEALKIIINLCQKSVNSDAKFANGLMLCHQADYLLLGLEPSSAWHKALAIIKMNLGMYAYYVLGDSQQAIILYESIVVDKENQELQTDINLGLGRLYLGTERWEKAREILDKLQRKHERSVAQYVGVWLLILTTPKSPPQKEGVEYIENNENSEEKTPLTPEQEELKKQIWRLPPLTYLKTEHQLLYALPVLLSIKLETAEWGCNKLKSQLENYPVAFQVSYYQLQAQISAAKKDLQGQVEAYQAIIALAPKQLEVREKLAILQVQQGNNDKAIETLTQALPISKDKPGKYVAIIQKLANRLIVIKQYEKAIQLLKEANIGLQNELQELAQNKYLLGNCYRDNQLYGEALKEYEQACKNSPTNLKYWLILLETLTILQKYPESLAFYQEALKHHPLNNSELFLWGTCLFHFNQDYSQMWSCFCRAVPQIESLTLNKTLTQELLKVFRAVNINEIEQQWLNYKQKENKTSEKNDESEQFWVSIYKIFKEADADLEAILNILNKGLSINGKHKVWLTDKIKYLCKKENYQEAAQAIEVYLSHHSRPDVSSLTAFAVSNGILELLKWWLVDHKLGTESLNLLVLACILGHISIIEYLVGKVNVSPDLEGIAFSSFEAKFEAKSLPLHMACAAGNIASVKALLAHKADVNAADDEGCTPLMLACGLGHVSIVQYLLDHKADVCAAMKTAGVKGLTPLHFACIKGCLATVEALLVRQTDVNVGTANGYTPLMEACNRAHLMVVQCLLGRKADVNATIKSGPNQGYTTLHFGCISGDSATVEALLAHQADVNAANDEGHTPLMLACAKGYAGVVQCLLDSKADVNATIKSGPLKGFTPLHFACANGGDIAIVEALLAHKADVNACSADEFTPLMFACAKGYATVVQCLLDSKADVNSTMEGLTPLHCGCFSGDIATVEALLAHKADVNACADGHTPLMLACVYGHFSVVQCLLDHKADVNATIKSGPVEGAIALHFASNNGDIASVKALLVHQADINAIDTYGWTPLTAACRHGHTTLIQYLLNNHKEILQNPINTQALADYYAKQGDLINAIECYKKTIKLDESNFDAHHNLACMYHVQGNYQLAEDEFKQALRTKLSASTYCDYGLLLLSLKRYEEAVKSFLMAISLGDDGSGLMYGKIEKSLLDDYLQREITSESDLKIKPFFIAHYWLVRCFYLLKDVELSKFYSENLVRITQRFPLALHYRILSYIHMLIDNKEEADECIAFSLSVEGIQAEQDQLLKINFNQAYLKELSELIDKTPTALRYRVLSYVYNAISNEEKAYECLAFALSLEPAFEPPINTVMPKDVVEHAREYSPTLFEKGNTKNDNSSSASKKEVALPSQDEIRKNYAEFVEKKKKGSGINSAVEEEQQDILADGSEASSKSDNMMQIKQAKPNRG